MRKANLSFVVVGGGATGVEIVGTLAKMLPRRMRDMGLDPSELSIILLEGRPDILYDLPQVQRDRARARLERMGVQVMTDSALGHIEAAQAHLVNGELIPAPVLVWCGGAKADPHAADWGFETDPSRRLVVDEYLRADGYDDVYVIGDVSAARHPETGRALPMLAQIAIQQGPATADGILRELAGDAPEAFEPHIRGEFVSIGPTWGVGIMYGVKLTGIPAIVMKRITYMKYWWQVGGVKLLWRRTREMLAMQR
jgi:NADH dehydrogenase